MSFKVKRLGGSTSINISDSGDTTIVDIDAYYTTLYGAGHGLSSEKLRIHVVSYLINATGPVSIKFKSGANDLSGPISMAVDGNTVSCSSVVNPCLFWTKRGEPLILNLDSPTQVGGHLTFYIG